MGKEIKYPMRVQSFSELIGKNYFYVDNTALIYQLINRKKYVFLSRPHNSGKSLLLYTLEAYFKGQKSLFKGLAISELETKWDTYPVFRIDLSSNSYTHMDQLISMITYSLDQIEQIYGLKSNHKTISTRFSELILQAYKRYGKDVVILIDEYDKPILDTLEDKKINEKIIAELNGFYANIKSNDQFIKFSMVTGRTRSGRIVLTNALNNFSDISTLPKYKNICRLNEEDRSFDANQPINDTDEFLPAFS